jgi:hypothetical protein
MTGSASSEEDIEMDDVDDDDIKVVSEGKKAYEVDYKSLTHQQVKDLMVADIEYISMIFGVEVSVMHGHLSQSLLTFVFHVPRRPR